MTVDLPTLGLGVALLAGGVDWRWRAIRRRREDFRRRAHDALEDQDRATRHAAVAVVTQQGLSAVAEILLETISRERDASVLDAIAEAVARNQWEPSYRPEVFELRLWAQRRVEARPSRPREATAVPLAGRNGHETEGAARLSELLELGGYGLAVTTQEASRRRALAVMAADGWRRLTVPSTPETGPRPQAERRR